MNPDPRLEILQEIRNHVGWMADKDFRAAMGFHKRKVIELAEKTGIDCDNLVCTECPIGDVPEMICIMVNNDYE